MGLVDLLLYMTQEALTPVGDGGCGGAWGAAALLCPVNEDPCYPSRRPSWVAALHSNTHISHKGEKNLLVSPRGENMNI